MERAGGRPAALLLALAVVALSTIAWPIAPASAAPEGNTAAKGSAVTAGLASGVPARLATLCSTEEWQRDPKGCVGRLQDVGAERANCLKAPIPSAPDSGLAGWFADRPDPKTTNGAASFYTLYGYAGYSYTTYDINCVDTLMHPDYKFENTVANGEFMLATAVIGASNALRERAWDPASMWKWADPLVKQATQAIYEKVFSVFGVLTLCVVGLYLLWRSRQSDMSNAMTTAGWALLVMVAVTALARWPVESAKLADNTLISTLGVVHDAVGPRTAETTPGRCLDQDPERCKDKRPPAVRASDITTESMLYRNWLRGALGSADSETAKKYGWALYDAKSLSWEELEKIQQNPETRNATISAKNEQWKKVAEQIKTEDPAAYEYLTGANGMERIGAGFIALLAAILFAMFDLTASLLVLLGFLIFRWAVIAAPVLGTVGLMRPASAGLRRLANAVVAAIFNIAIFGTGAAVYLFAVDLVMSTSTLPGWLQVMLVWLCGVVGWLLLRPYRRITQLGGGASSATIGSESSWHRRFFRDVREAAKLNGEGEPERANESRFGKRRQVVAEQGTLRPEARLEDPSQSSRSQPAPVTAGGPAPRPDGADPRPEAPAQPARRTAPEWTRPDVPEEPPRFVVYRPGKGNVTETAEPARPAPRIRTEAR